MDHLLHPPSGRRLRYTAAEEASRGISRTLHAASPQAPLDDTPGGHASLRRCRKRRFQRRAASAAAGLLHHAILRHVAARQPPPGRLAPPGARRETPELHRREAHHRHRRRGRIHLHPSLRRIHAGDRQGHDRFPRLLQPTRPACSASYPEGGAPRRPASPSSWLQASSISGAVWPRSPLSRRTRVSGSPSTPGR